MMLNRLRSLGAPGGTGAAGKPFILNGRYTNFLVCFGHMKLVSKFKDVRLIFFFEDVRRSHRHI